MTRYFIIGGKYYMNNDKYFSMTIKSEKPISDEELKEKVRKNLSKRGIKLFQNKHERSNP